MESFYLQSVRTNKGLGERCLNALLILQSFAIIWGTLTPGTSYSRNAGQAAYHMQSFSQAYPEDTSGIRNAITALSNEISQNCTLVVDHLDFLSSTRCDDFSAIRRGVSVWKPSIRRDFIPQGSSAALAEPLKGCTIDSTKYVWVKIWMTLGLPEITFTQPGFDLQVR